MHEAVTTVSAAKPITNIHGVRDLRGNAPLCKEVELRLASGRYAGLRGVRCDYHEGVLILRGRVPSYHIKQVAQEIARGIDGVEELINNVDVEGFELT